MRQGAEPPVPERIRASVVCVHHALHGAQLLCVRLRDPHSGIARLFPPGGAIEPGESPGAAAVRETLEETGHRVALTPHAPRIARYPYTWNATRRLVTTHFFGAELIGDRNGAAPVLDASYHEGVVWLPLRDLDRELGFEPAILDAVRGLLSS